jgi:TonB-linked SusC/RagA family outer membrane protein
MVRTLFMCAALSAAMSAIPSTALPAQARVELAVHTAPIAGAVDRPSGIEEAGLLLAPVASVSLKVRAASLDQVLTEVGRQTGIRFMYGEDVLASPRLVTLSLSNATLERTLNLVLSGTGLVTRRISRDALLVKERAAGSTTEARQGTISGRVTDAATQAPISGAAVNVVGTTLTAMTGQDGRFSIEGVPDGARQIRVSMVGYAPAEQTVTVTPGQSASVDFALQLQAISLSGVVAVGYATERARNVSGSITTVSAEQLDPVASVSVNRMLQGKAPGLNLTTRTTQPGGGVSANIRGAISPRGNNTPLYVVDGVPMTEYRSSVPGLLATDLGFGGGIDRDPLAFLNPSDIASITVLKDASAAAIYGSAAANGVVLVTTKSGTAGSVKVNYRASYTMERPHAYYPLLDSHQFMEEQNRLASERYLFDNKLAPYGTRSPSSVPPFIPLFTPDQIASGGTGTDWLGLVTRDGHIQEHNLSLSGGSANTYAFASFNYRNQDAILKGSTLARYSGRVNLDQRVSDAVHVSLRLSASQLGGNNASTGANSGGPEKFNMLQAAYSYAPTVPVYDGNDYSYSYNRVVMNPAAFLTISDNSRTSTLFATPSVEARLTESLKANVVGQVTQESTERSFYLPRTTNNAQAPDGMAQKSEGSVENYSTEGYLTYDTEFGESSLTLVGGGGLYRAMTEGSSMQGVGFFTDAFTYNNIGVSSDKLKNSISSYKSVRTKLSQFARLNYMLKERYILSLVGRRDGSSIFSEKHKYGFFPGASAAWIVSDEGFMEGLPQISQLKLRAGYGLAGNESILSGNTLQLYSPGYPFLIGQTLYNGVALSQIANPYLTWETMSSLNLGVDAGIWGQRVSGSFDYFVKTAHDLLDFNALPSNNAVGRVADNVGSTRSRGFEVALHTTNVDRSSGHWNTDLTFSHYTAHWLERNPQVPLATYVGSQDPLDAIYGWETDGIIRGAEDRPDYMPNANPGNLRYVDQNGDGQLDEKDVVILGNGAPRWTVGMNNSVRYRNLDLNVFVYGNLNYFRGNTYAPNTFAISQLTNPENTTVFAEDIWSSTNPDGTFPGIAANPYDNNNPEGNDFNLKDATFLRLKNVTLGYTIPNSWFGASASTRRARVFLDFQDLGLLTSYPGFDPEYTEANPYPKSYSTSLGVEVDF